MGSWTTNESRDPRATIAVGLRFDLGILIPRSGLFKGPSAPLLVQFVESSNTQSTHTNEYQQNGCATKGTLMVRRASARFEL